MSEVWTGNWSLPKSSFGSFSSYNVETTVFCHPESTESDDADTIVRIGLEEYIWISTLEIPYGHCSVHNENHSQKSHLL